MRKTGPPSSFGGFSAPIIVGTDGRGAEEAPGPRKEYEDYDNERKAFKEEGFSGQRGRFPPSEGVKSYARAAGDRPERRERSSSSLRPPRGGFQRSQQQEYQSRPSGGFNNSQPPFIRSGSHRRGDYYEPPAQRHGSGGYDRPSRNSRNDFGSPPRDFSGQRGFNNDDFRGPGGGRFGGRRENRAAPPPPYLPQGNYLDNGVEERMSSDFMRLCNVRQVDWTMQQLSELKKDFYAESDAVKERSAEQMQEWIDEHQILLHGDNIPRPCFEFSEPGFPPEILAELEKSYDKPTLIQCISWPVALSGQDIVSIARTGSGKTLGFLLPAIVHTLNQPARNNFHGPTVLVLLPTRELAQQACNVAKVYCDAVGLSVCAVFGGVPREQQHYELRKGVDICIATPGRLLAFIHSRVTSMRNCSFLVLDEADRMLEMGFEDQIRAIVSQVRPDRQTLMFSATWPVEVREFAKTFQTNPVFLNVGSLELSANHNITQKVEVMEELEKARRLENLLDEILEKNAIGKVIVFFDTKRKADELEVRLSMKWPVLCIHGDKTQQLRDQVMEEFKRGKGRILLATDIAARGLDVSNVEAVINFDYPMSTEQYVHRIGRTARHDKKGLAYTFFTPHNSQRTQDLIKILEEAKQEVPDKLRELIYPAPSNYYRTSSPC